MPADQAQRTEEPTPRRKEKAREEGQVPSSREFTAAVQFAVAVGLLVSYGDNVALGLRLGMRGLLREAFRPETSVEQLLTMVSSVALEPLSFLGYLAGVLLGIGLLMQLVQTGFAFTPKRLQPDFSRLKPGPKLAQLPGGNLSQTMKALVMMPLVGVVFWLLLDEELEGFLKLPNMSLPARHGCRWPGLRGSAHQSRFCPPCNRQLRLLSPAPQVVQEAEDDQARD